MLLILLKVRMWLLKVRMWLLMLDGEFLVRVGIYCFKIVYVRLGGRIIYLIKRMLS